MVRFLIFPALFWAAGVAAPQPEVLESIRASVATILKGTLTSEAPRVLIGQVLGWTLDVLWMADLSALSAMTRALTRQPEWQDDQPLTELAQARTSSLPAATDTLHRLQWGLGPSSRAILRTDDAGRLRSCRFGEDSPAVLKMWLTEAHKASATASCGRIRCKLHRSDPTLAVGLDLPRPVPGVRFAFQGHRKVYDSATTRAERQAALACGGTGWRYNAKRSSREEVPCFCSKRWPSRSHLLWSCPAFADERSQEPAPGR